MSGELSKVPSSAVQRPVGTIRSPVVGWLLVYVTLGIYILFWYHNLNRELRDYDRLITVRPGLAVLSLFVPIVGFVSIYNTGGRIKQAQTLAGVPPTTSGAIGILLSIFFALDVPYYSAQANTVWTASAA